MVQRHHIGNGIIPHLPLQMAEVLQAQRLFENCDFHGNTRVLSKARGGMIFDRDGRLVNSLCRTNTEYLNLALFETLIL